MRPMGYRKHHQHMPKKRTTLYMNAHQTLNDVCVRAAGGSMDGTIDNSYKACKQLPVLAWRSDVHRRQHGVQS